MAKNALPESWLPPTRKKITESVLCRFDVETDEILRKYADTHGISIAQVVRILVWHSLAELKGERAA